MPDPLNDWIELEIDGLLHSFRYNHNLTEINDEDGDPLLTIRAVAPPAIIEEVVRAFYLGRKVGERVGEGNAKREIRKALGID